MIHGLSLGLLSHILARIRPFKRPLRSILRISTTKLLQESCVPTHEKRPAGHHQVYRSAADMQVIGILRQSAIADFVKAEAMLHHAKRMLHPASFGLWNYRKKTWIS